MTIIWLHGNAIKKHLRSKGFDVTGARQVTMYGGFEVTIAVNLTCDINEFSDEVDELLKSQGPYGPYHVHIWYTQPGNTGQWQIITGERIKPEISPDANMDEIPY